MPFSSSATGPYGTREIRSLYPAVTEKYLRYLEKWGLIRHPAGGAGDREYSFTDLLSIRQVAAELERGTPLRTILRTLLAERQGQLELDFRAPHPSVDAPRARVVALEPRKRPPLEARAMLGPMGPKEDAAPFADPQAVLAARHFTNGAGLDDGTAENRAAAAAAYRRALGVDPDLVPAIVNLANLHYSDDQLIEAQALYERAIGLDPECFEAHFNLGNINHDLGRYGAALVCYRDAVELSPGYADAHFYLAVTLEKTGHSLEAKPHWRAYQELAPAGEWAELAEEFLE